VSGLELRGVEKRFGAVAVLQGVDLDVPAGVVGALLGASGSGKTTLLRVVAGFERVDRGVVTVGGEVVDDGRRAMAPERRRVGYVPQEGALFPHLTVERNVAFAFGRAARHQRDRVQGLLELVGLAGLGGRYPHQLSGGQQQRVALARALAASPRAILLDEPFSSLDRELRASVRAEVLGVLRETETTTLFVTHDAGEALGSADQVAVLLDGRIAQVGVPEDLYRRPASPQVARLLGATNLLPGVVGRGGVHSALGSLAIQSGQSGLDGLREGTAVLVLVHPEQVALVDAASSACAGQVVATEFGGHEQVVTVRVEGSGTTVLVRTGAERRLVRGGRVRLRVQGPVVVWTDPSAPRSEARSRYHAGWENTAM
jgi:iron(III) transport system ATP-binding protein